MFNSYLASYAGVLAAVLDGRESSSNNAVDAATAATIAAQIQAALVTDITPAQMPLVQAVVYASLVGRYVTGALPVALVAKLLVTINTSLAATVSQAQYSGTTTLVGGTVNIAFAVAQPDANYRVLINPTALIAAAESYYVTAKGVGGFTITSTVGASVAPLDWVVVR